MKSVIFIFGVCLALILIVNLTEQSKAPNSAIPLSALKTAEQTALNPSEQPLLDNGNKLKPETTSTNEIETNSISKAVELILTATNKYYYPTEQEISKIVESDKPLLMKEFREQSITNKIYSFWALVYLGGEDVRDEIIRFLEADYSSEILHSREMRAIETISIGLGSLAKEDQTAYDYLLSHIRPDDWIGVRKWDIVEPHADLNAFIAEAMIVAVGISGRDGASDVIDSITKWDPYSLDLIDGAVVEAYAYLNQDKSKTRKESVISRLNINRIDFYLKWKQTDEGKKWQNWFETRHHYNGK